MLIEKYASYFHDGDICSVVDKVNGVELHMESAELLPEWNQDNIKLSKRNTLSGKLHISLIKKIIENKKNNINTFSLKSGYEEASIYRFSIALNKIYLLISWVKYTPYYEESDLFEYEIEAGEIFWENIPNLFDEFWEAPDKNDLS